MTLNRLFCILVSAFFGLFLAACGSKPYEQSLSPFMAPAVTRTPEDGSGIGSYHVTRPINSLEGSSQEEIATQLFYGWLENFKSGAGDASIRLRDFTVQETTIPSEFQHCTKNSEIEFIASVTYSVEPMNPPSPDWDAGSGEPGSNNWINGKIAYIGIMKTKDAYSFRLLGVPPCEGK